MSTPLPPRTTPRRARPTHRAGRPGRAERLVAGGPLRAVRRSVAAALALTLPLGLAASVLTATTPSATGDPVTVQPAITPVAAAIPSPQLNTFTLNVLHDLPADQARADIERAMTLGDVGGFQEMSDVEDRDTVVAVATAKDWGWWMPAENESRNIPIVWNRARFRLIDGHSTMTHGATPGQPSRWVNVVRLRELSTGKVFGYINTHLIAQASFDAQLSDMSKIPLLRQHLQILRAEILGLAGTTENVFIGGDFNVNHLADERRKNAGLPVDALSDIINFDMPPTGSRGEGSLLDYGMTLKNDGGLALTSSNIVYDFNSDHDAVQFSYAPVDVFAVGAMFNDPKGSSYAKRDVVDRQLRAIQDSEVGATIRVVTSRLADQSVFDQLVAARTRGVNVQVVAGTGAATSQESALAAILGGDTAQPSFFKKCAGGCLGGSKGTQSNFLLVDRSGSATALTLVGSGPLQSKATGTYGSVYQSTDDALFAAYAGLFGQYVADAPLAARLVSAGSHQIQVFPSTADPVAKTLKRVSCTKAKGLAVKNKRTNVLVQVESWSGRRGKELATRLGELKREGCTVQVLTGKKVGQGIKRMLKAAKVDRKSAKIAQNVVIVDGRYRKKNRSSTVWMGGPAWSDGALNSDGTQLSISDKPAVQGYLGQFRSIWQSS